MSWECLTLYKLPAGHAALTLVDPAPSNTHLNFKSLQTEDWLQEASYCICESMSGVSQSAVSDSLPLHGLYSPPGSSVHGILQARILEWVAMPSSRGIFPTQGSNLVLLHCRQILYHLSHQRVLFLASHGAFYCGRRLKTSRSHVTVFKHRIRSNLIVQGELFKQIPGPLLTGGEKKQYEI